MAAFVAASVIPPNFTNIQNKKISNLAGSTGAELYKNSTDTKWVVHLFCIYLHFGSQNEIHLSIWPRFW
jgi:hypothetical protein